MTTTKLTLEEIKAKYPEPTDPDSDDDNSYCVGGALCGALGGLWGYLRFPSPLDLETVLWRELGLSDDQAQDLAGKIICANDDGNFAGAWGFLAEALKLADLTAASMRKEGGLP